MVLIYKDRELEEWEESDPDKFDRFWDWFNEIECVNLESEVITKSIENLYLDSIKLKNTG